MLAPRADAPPQDIAITFDDLVFLGNPTVARREQRSGEAAGSAEATKDVAQKPSEERLTTFTFVLVIRSGCRSMQRWREAARAADNVFRFEQQRIGYVSAETQRILLAVSPPPPPFRTNWTRLVPPPVLTGHVSSLLSASSSRPPPPPSFVLIATFTPY